MWKQLIEWLLSSRYVKIDRYRKTAMNIHTQFQSQFCLYKIGGTEMLSHPVPSRSIFSFIVPSRPAELWYISHEISKFLDFWLDAFLFVKDFSSYLSLNISYKHLFKHFLVIEVFSYNLINNDQEIYTRMCYNITSSDEWMNDGEKKQVWYWLMQLNTKQTEKSIY